MHVLYINAARLMADAIIRVNGEVCYCSVLQMSCLSCDGIRIWWILSLFLNPEVTVFENAFLTEANAKKLIITISCISCKHCNSKNRSSMFCFKSQVYNDWRSNLDFFLANNQIGFTFLLCCQF